MLPSTMKRRREQLDMTQEQAARAAGVSTSTIQKWEAGKGQRSPKLGTYIAALRTLWANAKAQQRNGG